MVDTLGEGCRYACIYVFLTWKQIHTRYTARYTVTCVPGSPPLPNSLYLKKTRNVDDVIPYLFIYRERWLSLILFSIDVSFTSPFLRESWPLARPTPTLIERHARRVRPLRRPPPAPARRCRSLWRRRRQKPRQRQRRHPSVSVPVSCLCVFLVCEVLDTQETLCFQPNFRYTGYTSNI